MKFLIPLLVLMRSLGAWADETYPIKLEYASKAGEKYHILARGSNKEQSVITTTDKTNTQTKQVVIELDGDIEVLEVDSKGHEKSISCVVKTCVARNGREKKALLKKGDAFVLREENGHKKFSREGEEMPPEEAEALSIVLSIHTRTMDDDDIFGTKDLKKIGDSWPVNSTAAMADLKTSGSPITPRDVEGSCRLVGIKVFKGESYLNISATMNAGIDFPAKPGMKVHQATTKAQFTGLFPVNNSRRPARETLSMTAVIKMDRETAAGLSTAEFLSERAVEKEFGN